MTTKKNAPIQRDWGSKSVAGTLLGFTLALLCSGLFARLAAGMAASAKAQLAMWLVVPVWLGVLSACYAFPSGRRAWLWLGAANLVALAALALARLS